MAIDDDNVTYALDALRGNIANMLGAGALLNSCRYAGDWRNADLSAMREAHIRQRQLQEACVAAQDLRDRGLRYVIGIEDANARPGCAFADPIPVPRTPRLPGDWWLNVLSLVAILGIVLGLS